MVVGLIGGGIAAGGAATISDATPSFAPALQTPTSAPAERGHRARPSKAQPFPPPAPAAPDTIVRHDLGAVAVVPSVGKPSSTSHAPKRAASLPAARSGDSLGGLGRDLSQIDETRRALRTGDASAAQALLDAYEHRRETSFFDREAVVLRIEALVQQGQRERAAKLAADYFRRFPNDVHAPRLRALLEGAGTPKEPGPK
jgi:hypothetical protein